MTQDMMTLRALLEKSSDADLLREMIGFTAERLMALEVEGLTGAGHGERSADRITVEPVVAGRIRPVVLRKVPPRGPGAKHPQNAVQHPPVIHPRHTPWLVRQQRLDHTPFEVSQIVTAHRKAPNAWKLESHSTGTGNPLMGTRPNRGQTRPFCNGHRSRQHRHHGNCAGIGAKINLLR